MKAVGAPTGAAQAVSSNSGHLAAILTEMTTSPPPPLLHRLRYSLSYIHQRQGGTCSQHTAAFYRCGGFCGGGGLGFFIQQSMQAHTLLRSQADES